MGQHPLDTTVGVHQDEAPVASRDHEGVVVDPRVAAAGAAFGRDDDGGSLIGRRDHHVGPAVVGVDPREPGARRRPPRATHAP